MTYTEFKIRYKCPKTSRTFFVDEVPVKCPYCEGHCTGDWKKVKIEVQVK